MSAGVIFAVLLGLIAAIVFIGADAGRNADGIFMATALVNSRSKAITNLSRLNDEAKIADPLLSDLARRLPDKDSLVDFLTYVKSLAAKYNGLSTSKFGEEFSGIGFSSIKFNISVAGDYASLLKFINDLDRSPYFINVTAINLVKQADKYNVLMDGSIMFKSQ